MNLRFEVSVSLLLFFFLHLFILDQAVGSEFACIAKGDFTEFDCNIYSINESNIELLSLNGDSACKVSNYSSTSRAIQNVGCFIDAYLLPKYKYRIEAKIIIKDKFDFEELPRLVVYKKDWNALTQGKKSFRKKDDIILEHEFTCLTNDICRVSIAVLGRAKKGKVATFQIKELVVNQLEGTEVRRSQGASTDCRSYVLENEYDEKHSGIQNLKDIAINNAFYRPPEAIRSLAINHYLHGVNSGLKIMYYFNVEAIYRESNLFKFINKNHPEWLVLDRSGNLVEEKGYPGNIIVDITNHELISWITDYLTKKAEEQDFDAFFLDMICAYFYAQYYSAPEMYSRVNGKIDDELWLKGFIEFIRLLKFKSKKFIIGNGIGTYNSNQYFGAYNQVRRLIKDLDGVFIEEFVVNNLVTDQKTNDNNSLDAKMLLDLLSAKKDVFVSTNASEALNKLFTKSISKNKYLVSLCLEASKKVYLRVFTTEQAKAVQNVVNQLGEVRQLNCNDGYCGELSYEKCEETYSAMEK